ncbi:MAG: hypothetical protein K2X77_17165 [Candidatus Obscuribacterales bacterium]|jgi:hypothetical protein|nr:hypothetical protein [Candidatus Obscuribacterales bacterium]
MSTAGREIKHQNDFVNGAFLVLAFLLTIMMAFIYFSMNNGGDRSVQTPSQRSTVGPDMAPSTIPGKAPPGR